jgi:kynurenine formamidase
MEKWTQDSTEVRIYDLSTRLTNKSSAFETNPHHIEYITHTETIHESEKLFGIGPEAWRGGCGWAMEKVTLTTHSGTHLDAPYHYGARSGGKPAKTIDEVPLRWCYGDGVLLDVRHIDRRKGVDENDLQAELDGIGYVLKPYDIVLIRTDASKHFLEPGYQYKHTGLRASATKWLTDHGIRMIGIDAWTLDRAFDVMVEEAKAGHTEQLWESHYWGMTQEYCQIEKLSGLDQLPTAFGFKVMCFPVKIEGASGGWARVVAVYEN